jgi:hypothetical protein
MFQPNDELAVPSVVLIGTAKAGTSDMYVQLASLTPGDYERAAQVGAGSCQHKLHTAGAVSARAGELGSK